MRRLIRWGLGHLRATWAYLRERPVRLVVVLLALIAGNVAGMPVGKEVFRYTWMDARFCDDCHTHDYANQAWARSVHGKLTTCHDCHRVPIRHYPLNLWVTVTNKPQTQDDIHRPDVATVICEQCHSESGASDVLTGPLPTELREQVVKIDHSPLHKLHLESDTREPGNYRGGGNNDDAKEDAVHGLAGGEGHEAAAVEHGGEHEAAATERAAPAAEHGEEPGGDHGGGHGGGAHFSGPIGCMDCHGSANNRAHQFQANRENCLECHPDQKLAGKRLETLSCRECHFAGFLSRTEEEAAAAEIESKKPHAPAEPTGAHL